MAYTLEVLPGEKVVLDIDYRRKSVSESLRFVVTDQALFVPAMKFRGAGDPRYLKRIPLSEAVDVRVQVLKPYAAYAVALIMVTVGLIALWSFTVPDARMTPIGLARGIAIIVGGGLMPMAARGRRCLLVHAAGETFKWLPPLHVDVESKHKVNELLNQVVAACRSVNVPTQDDRLAA